MTRALGDAFPTHPSVEDMLDIQLTDLGQVLDKYTVTNISIQFNDIVPNIYRHMSECIKEKISKAGTVVLTTGPPTKVITEVPLK